MGRPDARWGSGASGRALRAERWRWLGLILLIAASMAACGGEPPADEADGLARAADGPDAPAAPLPDEPDPPGSPDPGEPREGEDGNPSRDDSVEGAFAPPERADVPGSPNGRRPPAGDGKAPEEAVPDGSEGTDDPGIDPEEEAPPEAEPPEQEDGARGIAAEGASEDVERAARGTPEGEVDRLRFPRPDSIRGIYLNAWASGSRARSEALLDLARRTEVNTFVVDVKDASGYVSYRTDVELAREVGADQEIRIRDIAGLLERMADAGVYPIARIVVFQDPLVAAARHDMAVLEKDGELWIDRGGHAWVNAFDRDVWDYNIALAREAAELGFPEIQWDYVRFPDAPASVLEGVRFPGAEGRTRSAAIREFLAYAREELADLDVRLTADVFGMATTAANDVGIGQRWEDFIDVVDVALPMIYPSHYWAGSFGLEEPNRFPYEVVRGALARALERSEAVEGAGEVIPWLQDFTLGPPRYEAPEVRAQIQATYDLGVPHWILWNASSRYTEDALAPAEGFEDDDVLIRLGGEVVPASYRFAEPDTAMVDDGVLLQDPTGPTAPLDLPGGDAIAPGDTTGVEPEPGDAAEAEADTVLPEADPAPPDSAGPDNLSPRR